MKGRKRNVTLFLKGEEGAELYFEGASKRTETWLNMLVKNNGLTMTHEGDKLCLLLPKSMIINAAPAEETEEDGDLSTAIARDATPTAQEKAIAYLKEKGWLTAEEDQHYGMPEVDLTKVEIEPDVIKLVPRELADKYLIIPIGRVGNSLILAMRDPSNILALDDVMFATGLHVEPVVSSEASIKAAIEKYYATPAAATAAEPMAPPPPCGAGFEPAPEAKSEGAAEPAAATEPIDAAAFDTELKPGTSTEEKPDETVEEMAAVIAEAAKMIAEAEAGAAGPTEAEELLEEDAGDAAKPEPETGAAKETTAEHTGETPAGQDGREL